MKHFENEPTYPHNEQEKILHNENEKYIKMEIAMLNIDNGLISMARKRKDFDAALVQIKLYNHALDGLKKEGAEVKENNYFPLSEVDKERVKELVLDYDDARNKRDLYHRETLPLRRKMMWEDNRAFNVCPVCSRTDAIKAQLDQFGFCSEKCDTFDSECTPQEREENKARALKFYNEVIEKGIEFDDKGLEIKKE